MARPHGTKNIKTPEILWDLFTEYKAWAKDNPVQVQDYVGKDGDEVMRKRERALIMEGFENYCFRLGVASDLADYFLNKQDRYSDYAIICRAIRREIREDQITGGMAGVYNPSITQRLNGLVEKNESKVQIEDLNVSLKLD